MVPEHLCQGDPAGEVGGGHIPTICTCGFDFVKGQLDGVDIESYAAIPDDCYADIIQSEAAMAAEQDESRQLEMMAEGATRVGTIKVCPDCGMLCFSRPMSRAQSDDVAWFRPLA